MSIQLSHCTFRYRRWNPPVLDGLTFTVPHGLSILLGPNGAGKSTLLKLAAGVLTPRAGTVKLDGQSSNEVDYRRSVAWMPQNVTPMPRLTAREYVAYAGWLKGMSTNHAYEAAKMALSRVDLTAQADARTHHLSGGQLRRLGVAAALVHDARILLLDEPTAGMDPHQRRIFRDLAGELSAHVHVLISTHDIADLAEEADHVSVLVAGSMVHSGTTAEFLALSPPGVAEGRRAEAAYSALMA
ncbi:ABC transporter ATP-binding protein [Streptomyces sp. NPDC015408]|uniref:ABC transporter ATP-binding protein n=1 Tax=Streptomyces sp. NPDC015408 TaxID=3364956 RepID=UPI0036F9AB72